MLENGEKRSIESYDLQVDEEFNGVGYTSLADMMSPEDAEKYLKFLEEGSTSGLTSEELAGIGKVDELLALNNVNYQDVLDLRKINVIKGGSNYFKVNYGGGESPIYRGGNEFTVKSNEVKINPQTGNVKTSHGVSLDVNPKTVLKFGGAYRIETLPEGLNIIHRGARAEHFEIVPAYEMPLEQFQELLNQITFTGPY